MIMDNKDIDELVRLLDAQMSAGAGHINLTADEDAVKTEVTTTQNLCGKNMACQIPNLHEGYDD